MSEAEPSTGEVRIEDRDKKSFQKGDGTRVSSQELPDQVVRNMGQFSGKLHRQDREAEEPIPACPEGPDTPHKSGVRESEKGPSFRNVKPETHRSYELCLNPECFGEGWR